MPLFVEMDYALLDLIYYNCLIPRWVLDQANCASNFNAVWRHAGTSSCRSGAYLLQSLKTSVRLVHPAALFAMGLCQKMAVR